MMRTGTLPVVVIFLAVVGYLSQSAAGYGLSNGHMEDTCHRCMRKQQENDEMYQTLWQLHVEKAWCLRHFSHEKTKEAYEECLALEVHIAEELETMYGGVVRRMYTSNARAYLQFLLQKESGHAAAADTAANMASILYELNPRALSLGNLRTSYDAELQFIYNPTAANFRIARDAIIRRGAMLSHMHAFYL